VPASHDELRNALADLISIPSVSADPDRAEDVARAAEWVAERIRGAGGEADLLSENGELPLVVGEIAASKTPESAPSVLCYAHFDVQPAEPLELWHSPPYELAERDGWLYARGVADDKAHLLLLVEAAQQLASEGELPVNVRFLLDPEEESGGQGVVEWVNSDARGADAAFVFDGDMAVKGVPTFYTALRGLCYFHVRVRTGERDLHSGLFGGAALNASHALVRMLSALLPGADGRLPEPLRASVRTPTEEERSSWQAMEAGAEVLGEVGAKPADATASDEFYLRTWAEPSVDIHGLAAGSPEIVKTVLPVEARANVSIRIAPGQSVEEIAPAMERLLREAAPAGTEVDVQLTSHAQPGLVSPDAAALQLAGEAFEHVFGKERMLVRVGGSIPVVSALAARGIPAVVTGVATKDANAHSPDERFPADYLDLGLAAVRETYLRLGQLA
jgi:acetylornithine deacetylase/succinyl-diaminopimelate desuccinylase-like protein